MYSADYLWAEEMDYLRLEGGFTRPYHDVQHAAAYLIPDHEHVVTRRGISLGRGGRETGGYFYI